MPVAIVTGANTGLGFETAKSLAKRGYQVLITSRDRVRAEAAISRIKTELPEAEIDYLLLDLSSEESINTFADRFKQKNNTWDLLVNNAGAKILKDFSRTDYGVEYHFGVNAVGHFAITMDLLPLRNQMCKVVSVSSIIARFAPEKLGPSGTEDSYLAGASYAASKLSNLLFARELDTRLGSDNFSSVAAHPGFARAEPYGPKSTRFFESFLAQSAKAGAASIIEAAVKNYPGGTYLAPRFLELWGKPKIAKPPILDTVQNQKANWEILESLSKRELLI
jgi:NAD(P)-dependent dehydrogenase (short-subunit alcohol dehydrogenase family)